MSWSWSFVPARLLNDGAFIRLSKADRALLYGCYHSCDKWGCGPAEPVALGRAIGDFDFDGLAASMRVLHERGFVALSACGAAWQLDRYEDDAPAELIRRRGRPTNFAKLFLNDSGRQATPDNIQQAPGDAPNSDDECAEDAPDQSSSTRAERQAKRRGATEAGRQTTPKKDGQGAVSPPQDGKKTNDSRRQAESSKVPTLSGDVQQSPDNATHSSAGVRHRLEQTETETVPLTGNRLGLEHESPANAPASSPSPLRGEASSGANDPLLDARTLLRDFDWPLDNEAPLDDEVRKALRVVAQDREIDPEELRWELWKGRYWPTEQATDEAWHKLAYGTSSWLTVPEIVQVWVEQMQRVSPDPRLPAPPSYLHIGDGPKPGILILAEDLRLVLQRLLAGGYEQGASTSTSFMRWRETKRRAGCGWHDADRAVTAMMRRALDGETVAPPPSHEEVFLRRWATLDADARWMVARQELAKTRERGRAVLNFAHLDVVKAALLNGDSVEGASLH